MLHGEYNDEWRTVLAISFLKKKYSSGGWPELSVSEDEDGATVLRVGSERVKNVQQDIRERLRIMQINRTRWRRDKVTGKQVPYHFIYAMFSLTHGQAVKWTQVRCGVETLTGYPMEEYALKDVEAARKRIMNAYRKEMREHRPCVLYDLQTGKEVPFEPGRKGGGARRRRAEGQPQENKEGAVVEAGGETA